VFSENVSSGNSRSRTPDNAQIALGLPRDLPIPGLVTQRVGDWPKKIVRDVEVVSSNLTSPTIFPVAHRDDAMRI
jgi:hypothetical protein